MVSVEGNTNSSISAISMFRQNNIVDETTDYKPVPKIASITCSKLQLIASEIKFQGTITFLKFLITF